jgi:hypothetical protein
LPLGGRLWFAGEKGMFLFCGESVARDGCPYCADYGGGLQVRPPAAKRPAAVVETREAGRRKLIDLAADI